MRREARRQMAEQHALSLQTGVRPSRTELAFLAQSLRIVFDLGAVDDPAFVELRSHRPIFPSVARIELPVATRGPMPVYAVFHNGVEQCHIGRLVIRIADDVLVRDFGIVLAKRKDSLSITALIDVEVMSFNQKSGSRRPVRFITRAKN
jgi:hypothetical protein